MHFSINAKMHRVLLGLLSSSQLCLVYVCDDNGTNDFLQFCVSMLFYFSNDDDADNSDDDKEENHSFWHKEVETK